jgi:hypothetical protein
MRAEIEVERGEVGAEDSGDEQDKLVVRHIK